jgi:hypothetical protein
MVQLLRLWEAMVVVKEVEEEEEEEEELRGGTLAQQRSLALRTRSRSNCRGVRGIEKVRNRTDIRY